MISQSDFDRLQDQLESLRGVMLDDPRTAVARIDALTDEAHAVAERAEGTSFEPAIKSVQGLLASLRRGVAARSALDDCLRHAA